MGRGGARAGRWTAGAAGTIKCGLGEGCENCPGRKKLVAAATNAGEFSHFEAEDFSWLAGRVMRLPTGASSASLRMTRRSSLAEITGKRTARVQASASRHCRAPNLRRKDVVAEARHNHKAGSARSSHARFSDSSIKNYRTEVSAESFSDIPKQSQCDYGLTGAKQCARCSRLNILKVEFGEIMGQ